MRLPRAVPTLAMTGGPEKLSTSAPKKLSNLLKHHPQHIQRFFALFLYFQKLAAGAGGFVALFGFR